MSETICGYEPPESEFFDAEVEVRQLVVFSKARESHKFHEPGSAKIIFSR